MTQSVEVELGERQRSCALSRMVRPEGELIRFVAAPDGTVVADLAARLPGRGAWVTGNRESVEEAVRKGVFPRALKAQVTASAGLAEVVETQLRRRALAYLSMANKAGEVVTGFFKLETALGRGELSALFHAQEAAADGREKLDRKLKAAQPAAPAPIGLFSVEELSLALGRANVVHAGLKGGGASRKLLGEVRRLGLFVGLEALAPTHFMVEDGTESE